MEANDYHTATLTRETQLGPVPELPTEMICDILQLTNNPTLKSARLVNRIFHNAATPLLFEEIFVDAFPKSLADIDNISSRHDLAKLVKKVTVITDQLPTTSKMILGSLRKRFEEADEREIVERMWPDYRGIFGVCSCPSPSTEVAYAKYEECRRQQNSVVEKHLKDLPKIFLQLKNLEEVSIGSGCDMMGPVRLTSSWKNFYIATGCSPTHWCRYLDLPSIPRGRSFRNFKIHECTSMIQGVCRGLNMGTRTWTRLKTFTFACCGRLRSKMRNERDVIIHQAINSRAKMLSSLCLELDLEELRAAVEDGFRKADSLISPISNAKRLKVLEIGGPSSDHRNIYDSYAVSELLQNHEHVWPEMATLIFRAIPIDGIIHFITRHKKDGSLRHIELDGCWMSCDKTSPTELYERIADLHLK